MNHSLAIANPKTDVHHCITPEDQTKNISKTCAALYRSHAPKVRQKCRYMLKSKTLAEDATHDIFIKIYLHLADYEAKANITTWIYTITYNHCLDILRKQRKHPVVDLQPQEGLPIADTTEPHQHKEQQFIKLEAALSRLPRKERTILQMKYHEGRTIQEIADKMHTTENAMKMRLKRAKERTRQKMEAL